MLVQREFEPVISDFGIGLVERVDECHISMRCTCATPEVGFWKGGQLEMRVVRSLFKSHGARTSVLIAHAVVLVRVTTASRLRLAHVSPIVAAVCKAPEIAPITAAADRTRISSEPVVPYPPAICATDGA